MLAGWWQSDDDNNNVGNDSWFDYDEDQMSGGAKAVKAPGLLAALNSKSLKNTLAYRHFLYKKGLNVDESSMKEQNEFKKAYNNAQNKAAFIKRWEKVKVKSPSKNEKAIGPAKRSSEASRSKASPKKTAKKTAKKSPKKKTAKKTAKKSPKKKSAQKSPFQKYQASRTTGYQKFKDTFLAKGSTLSVDGVKLPRTAALARQLYNQRWKLSPERALAKKKAIKSSRFDSPRKRIFNTFYGDKGEKFIARHPEYRILTGAQRLQAFARHPETLRAYKYLRERIEDPYTPAPSADYYSLINPEEEDDTLYGTPDYARKPGYELVDDDYIAMYRAANNDLLGIPEGPSNRGFPQYLRQNPYSQAMLPNPPPLEALPTPPPEGAPPAILPQFFPN